jgi:hypothetical protein
MANAVEASAPIEGVCPGSGEMLHENHTDGNGVATCGVCPRYVLTEAVTGPWRRVEDHRPGRIVKARLVEMAHDEAVEVARDAHVDALMAREVFG